MSSASTPWDAASLALSDSACTDVISRYESYSVPLTSCLCEDLQQERKVVRHQASLTGQGREPQPEGPNG